MLPEIASRRAAQHVRCQEIVNVIIKEGELAALQRQSSHVCLKRSFHGCIVGMARIAQNRTDYRNFPAIEHPA
jgi:hypothetical protein